MYKEGLSRIRVGVRSGEREIMIMIREELNYKSLGLTLIKQNPQCNI